MTEVSLVQKLQELFPTVEQDIILSALDASSNNINLAIEKLLEFTDPEYHVDARVSLNGQYLKGIFINSLD